MVEVMMGESSIVTILFAPMHAPAVHSTTGISISADIIDLSGLSTALQETEE
jgi:hypothetical protein